MNITENEKTSFLMSYSYCFNPFYYYLRPAILVNAGNHVGMCNLIQELDEWFDVSEERSNGWIELVIIISRKG